MSLIFPDTPASILRLILTPECNLRCIYCHNEGFEREIDSFSALPLIVESFPDVLRIVIDIFGGNQVHVSTNGVRLDRHLDLMKDLGVARINVSCDAVDRIQYQRITGRDCFTRVVENIESAVDYNFFVNVNCVTLNGINMDRDYVYSMLDFWREMGVRLSILRLCFAFDRMNEYKYDINELITLFNSNGMNSFLTSHNNRPPTLCYNYHDLEVAVRYYVPNRSNYPCTACHKRERGWTVSSS
ncbi:MAG: radical SAM protein [Deltaproteobacteria bacterium]|nr:radical SAM protein [Deltaproteobacteria bacterium]